MACIKTVVTYVGARMIGLYFSIFVLFHFLKTIIRTRRLDIFKVKSRPTPPACLNDPELGSHAYVNLKNIKLHYVEKGDKTKPLMLFLHGFPEFWYSWRYQIKEFSKDYWTVAVDLRGYGDSDKPKDIDQYQISYIIQDVDNFIKALGKEKCILVGHDWGGIIALYFVQNYPQCVESYAVLCSGHPKAFGQVVLSNMQQLKKSWYMFFYQIPYLPELSLTLQDMKVIDDIFKVNNDTVTSMDIEAYKYTFSKGDGFTPAINYYRRNFFRAPVNSICDKNLQLPRGLFLYADQDPYIELEIAEKTVQVIDNLKLERIPDGSHFIQQDKPEEVNRRLSRFLKDVHC